MWNSQKIQFLQFQKFQVSQTPITLHCCAFPENARRVYHMSKSSENQFEMSVCVAFLCAHLRDLHVGCSGHPFKRHLCDFRISHLVHMHVDSSTIPFNINLCGIRILHRPHGHVHYLVILSTTSPLSVVTISWYPRPLCNRTGLWGTRCLQRNVGMILLKIPNPPKKQIPRIQDAQSPKYQHSKIPTFFWIQEFRIPNVNNSEIKTQIVKIPKSQILQFQNSKIPKLPNSQTQVTLHRCVFLENPHRLYHMLNSS